MPGRIYNILLDCAFDQYGFVTSEDAKGLGINLQRLVDMERRDTLERVAHGLYRFKAIPYSGHEHLMEAVLWPRRTRGVLSHDTALDIHDLCDINPARIHLTVPRHYRINRDVPATYVVHHRDLAADERAVVEGIPTVTPLRAILDGIDTNIDPKLIDQAVDSARRRGLVRGKDLESVELQLQHRDSA